MATLCVAAIRAAVPLVNRAVIRIAIHLANRAVVRAALHLVFTATIGRGVFKHRGARREPARCVVVCAVESLRELADPRAERVVLGADPLVVLPMCLFSRRRCCCLRRRLSFSTMRRLEPLWFSG